MTAEVLAWFYDMFANADALLVSDLVVLGEDFLKCAFAYMLQWLLQIL